jgi:hypothetical protein
VNANASISDEGFLSIRFQNNRILELTSDEKNFIITSIRVEAG